MNNFYNLGFGDKNEETGELDDIAVSNNGDGEKVLVIVASSLDKYLHISLFQDKIDKAKPPP